MFYLLRFIFILFLFSAVNNLIAQQNFSVISATRTAVAPKIDGIPTDSVWVKTGVAFEFTQLQPNPNFLSTQKTEVRILYDDQGIYILASLFDNASDSILRQMGPRDEFNNNTDAFGIF